jgi:hypothetical protein
MVRVRKRSAIRANGTVRRRREEAVPQIARIAGKQPLAAFLLLQRAEQILPGDAQLAAIGGGNEAGIG